jgi:hypothetical protein
MTIQPLATGRPREISVTEAIDPAYERVKQMLFRPFNLAKWITIGFGAWLAGFGESGGGGFNGFNGGNHNSGGNHSHPAEQFRHFYFQARDYVAENFYWITPVAVIVALVLLAIWLLVLWLSSRGKFMFLHCVALDVAEVEMPWRKFAGAANSVFRFRVAVGLAGMILMLPLLVFLAIVILKMVLQGEADVAGVLTAIGLGLGLFLLSLVFALVHKFLMDFVVPIMFLRGGTCLAAWREFYALFTANFWRFVLYVLFQIVLNMAIGVIVLLAMVVTCCLACCLMMMPFVGTVLLLPVLVFKRAYSLYYLAQYDPQYDVFPVPPVPPASPLQPLVAG